MDEEIEAALMRAGAQISALHTENKSLRAQVARLSADAERWKVFTRHASLGFTGAPGHRALIGFPVFDHEDQTITALVDRLATKEQA